MRWLGHEKKFCPVLDTIVWLKRATGIGYRAFPPIMGGVVPHGEQDRLKNKSNEVARDVERLERELRRVLSRGNTGLN